jgi:ABC-2 type transport system permease protein
MLADAIGSEAYKLSKNRSAWFWGFAFPAIVALILGLGAAIFMHSQDMIRLMPINMAGQLLKAVADAGSPLTQLLVLVPAASLFGGEYRWETWRLLIPRNSRFNLLTAKIVVFAVGCALAVLLLGLSSLVASGFMALINGNHLTWDPGARFGLNLLGQFAVSWAQLMAAGAVAALIGVITRSNVGAIIVPILFGIVQSILGGLARMDPEHLAPLRLLGLPGLASDILHNYVAGNVAPMNGHALAQESAVTMALWIISGFGLALLYFSRQDLSKE